MKINIVPDISNYKNSPLNDFIGNFVMPLTTDFKGFDQKVQALKKSGMTDKEMAKLTMNDVADRYRQLTEPPVQEYVCILKSNTAETEETLFVKARTKEQAVEKLQNQLDIDYEILWNNCGLAEKYFSH